MATSVAQKLRIKAGQSVFPVNPPADYKKSLGPLPAGTKIVSDASAADQLHWFVKDRAQLEKELGSILRKLRGEMIIWIFYPKGTSKIQTDLTRDKGWDALLKNDQLHWLSLVSFDDTWSTFACRLKTEADKKKDAAPQKREIFDYIDAVKKTVRLPDDLAAALKKNKKAEAFFSKLSFSCRKEYVEWIVTAKREETRQARIEGTLERLVNGWKNPQNR